MLLNILQHTGAPSATKNDLAPNISIAKVENPGLEPQNHEQIEHLILR